MDYQLPDWDAYEYNDRLYRSKERVMSMIKKKAKFQDAVIYLRRYKFVPFNATVAEVKKIMQDDKEINAYQMTETLMGIHGLAYWGQVIEEDFVHVEKLERVIMMLIDPSSDETKAQELLTDWCQCNSTINGGNYYATGETVQIDLQELNLGE